MLKGCPLDNEAAALFRAGTRCAEPDAIVAAASGGGLLPSSRACTVTAAFDAAAVDGSRCDAVHLRPPAAGLPVGGNALRVGAGVGVLRPLDVRVSLGGPLPLLPLLDSVHAWYQKWPYRRTTRLSDGSSQSVLPGARRRQ